MNRREVIRAVAGAVAVMVPGVVSADTATPEASYPDDSLDTIGHRMGSFTGDVLQAARVCVTAMSGTLAGSMPWFVAYGFVCKQGSALAVASACVDAIGDVVRMAAPLGSDAGTVLGADMPDIGGTDFSFANAYRANGVTYVIASVSAEDRLLTLYGPLRATGPSGALSEDDVSGASNLLRTVVKHWGNEAASLLPGASDVPGATFSQVTVEP